MTGSTSTFATIVARLVVIVNAGVLPLLYALAFLYFVAGIAQYVIGGEGEESRDKAKKMMIYGIIGLIVLFSVWGIVNLLLGTLFSITGTTSTSAS